MPTKSYSPFCRWLDEWYANLVPLSLSRAVRDPACAAVCVEDAVNGYFIEGAFASPRLATLVAPMVHLLQRAYQLGMRNFVLLQDAHSEHAAEFKHFPVHCVRGSHEAQTIQPLRELGFASEFFVIKKNSFHPALNTELDRWLDSHQDLATFIIAGGCTDLCTYPMAMHLKQRANARDLPLRVIVPANLVNTYDVPVTAAARAGALPHDADLLHRIFLYHMALSGIEVVKQID